MKCINFLKYLKCQSGGEKKLSRSVTTNENGSLIKYLHLRETLDKIHWTVNKMKIPLSELCEKTIKQEKPSKPF